MLRLKKPAFDLVWRVVRALVPFLVLPLAPSEIFTSEHLSLYSLVLILAE